MKKFIVKILFFLVVPILLTICIGTILKIKFRNNIEHYQTLILGDSQTEFIRLPEIYNRSVHGSPYYVHYEFVKEFMEQIKGKKVYIACNYHNLSKLYQNRLATDSLMPGWRADTFRSLDEYHLINHKYLEIRPKDLEYSFFDIKKIPRLYEKLYLSGKNTNSLESVINDTLSIDNAINRHWRHPGYVLNDTIQDTYLEKLILLLKENNCEVILLKMPLTNYYKTHVPSEIKRKLVQLPNKYKLRLLDLDNALKISHDYVYFKDFGHLNKNGDSLVINFFKRNEQ